MAVAGIMRRRPTLAAALLYAVLALAFVSPALVPGKVLSSSDLLWFAVPWQAHRPAGLERPANPELGDAATQYQPFMQYTRDELPQAPLWNPYVMGGRPFLANGQSAVFSPFSAPAYTLPFWRSLAVIAALKLFVAALGTFLLARALGQRFGGALLGGIVFGFCLFLVSWLSWPLASVFVFMPWLLFASERVVQRPDALSGAGLAVVVALQFVAGHPESSFQALAGAVVFFGWRLVRASQGSRRSGGRSGPALIVFGVALAGGAALAAAALVPFLELIRGSPAVEQRGGAAFHEPARSLLTVVLPNWFGRGTTTGLEGFLNQHAFYAGALPLMLASAALILRPRSERVTIAAFGGICLALAVGMPPFSQVVNALPVFDAAANDRFAVFFPLSVALLAGWGLDDLAQRVPSVRARRRILAFAVALLMAPFVWLLIARPALSLVGPAVRAALDLERPPGAIDPSASDVIRLAALVVWLAVAGAATLLLYLRLRNRLAAVVFMALAVTLVAVDMFWAGMGLNPAIDRDNVGQPATGAIRYLQSRRPARFAGLGSGPVTYPVPPNLAMRYGLYDARGYDLPVLRRYDMLWRREVAPKTLLGVGVPFLVREPGPRALAALSLLSTADIVQRPSRAPLRVPGLRLAYDGRDARVYANDRALPRAFIAGRQRVIADEHKALDAVTRPGFDGRGTVVTERALPGLARAGGRLDGAASGSARIVSYEPERVTVRARTKRRGVLVLTDVQYPGWKASVDGHPADIERVDYLLRGVVLPPGEHRVEFRYQPLSWRLGWIVSLLALVGLALVVGIGLRRRRAEARG